MYRFLADLTVLAHFGFILFVIGGGLLVLRWRRLVRIHLPCAAWGALIEFAGWICPLTPLEQAFRRRAGGGAYAGGFIEHYILPVMYPAALTLTLQVVLGLGVVVLNALIYWWIWRRRAAARQTAA